MVLKRCIVLSNKKKQQQIIYYIYTTRITSWTEISTQWLKRHTCGRQMFLFSIFVFLHHVENLISIKNMLIGTYCTNYFLSFNQNVCIENRIEERQICFWKIPTWERENSAEKTWASMRKIKKKENDCASQLFSSGFQYRK